MLSTDPAHSLGDALGTRLGPRPVRVVGVRGRLDAVELDADRALERWLAARRAALRAIAERGTYLDDEDIERLFRLSLPGVDELMGLIELTRLARAGGYGDVVVDTAPTGHTLRLLAMPQTLRRLATVLDHMYAKHRFLAERLGGAYRPDASDAVIEELDAQGRALHALLRDARRCAFSWVLLPEALSLEEAKDAVRELDRAGMAVREIVVNRVTPAPDRACGLCGGRRRAERTAIAAIRRAFPGRPLRFVPAAASEPRGPAPLRAVARALRGTPRAVGPLAAVPARAAAGCADGGGATAPAAWLDALGIRDARLVLFAGKGGVGKTTCAATAALALAAAAPTRRVLLLSTDPAHSLGDALAVPLSDEDRPLAGAPPRLRARELDADRAFRRRREAYRAAVDALFDAVRRRSGLDAAFDRAVVQDLIDLAPPGVDELFAVLSVAEALVPGPGRPARYDAVVVDTAPTGHTLRLLALPGAALAWVRALLATLLKYREVIRLGDLAEDLVALSRDLRALEALLHDARDSRVVVVTRAAAVPRLETARLLERLPALGIALAALIVNAVTPPGAPRCRRCEQAAMVEAREIETLHEECRARAPDGCALLLAPAVAPPPRGIRALTRWGLRWAPRGAGA